ncbi:hypothetical protein [Enhygromyxa salina]|uniref:hypothetical protein n=1 Tax=Enhygromyxa salina TaxID=215803 RepID=UPI0011B1E149|nr:hypothetical protein [Enhygromyxa salina]
MVRPSAQSQRIIKPAIHVRLGAQAHCMAREQSDDSEQPWRIEEHELQTWVEAPFAGDFRWP